MQGRRGRSVALQSIRGILSDTWSPTEKPSTCFFLLYRVAILSAAFTYFSSASCWIYMSKGKGEWVLHNGLYWLLQVIPYLKMFFSCCQTLQSFCVLSFDAAVYIMVSSTTVHTACMISSTAATVLTSNAAPLVGRTGWNVTTFTLWTAILASDGRVGCMGSSWHLASIPCPLHHKINGTNRRLQKGVT